MVHYYLHCWLAHQGVVFMNERIRELVRESHLDVYSLGLDKVKWEAALTKYAELIVRECAGVGYDASYYECALNVSNKIKQHFGVEE
jgi:hypothetical protein